MTDGKMLQGTPVPFQLRKRMEVLEQAAGQRGWRPTRLILQNYWLFDYEEFHFVHGRLVLRGANGSGKSSVLSSAIPMVLDMNLRPERLDTFGSRSRSVYEYLVGPRDLQKGTPGHHEDRRGYIALEFRHGESGRYVTIGVGLYTSRSRLDSKVTSWGFVIEDGERIGYDVCLHTTDGPAPVSLTQGQLKTVLGSANRVVSEGREYQEAVNRALFGFGSVAEYRFLMDLLIELRSPKLNKDIKPEDVCEMLGNAMPALDEGLLTKVAAIIENIDSVAEDIATTKEQLAAIEEIDKYQGDFLNQKAQQAGVDFREHYEALEVARQTLSEAETVLETRRREVQSLEEAMREGQENRTYTRSRLAVLENHEIYKRHGELSRLEADLRLAEEQVQKLKAALASTEQALNRHLQAHKNLDDEWQAKLESMDGQSEELREAADGAAWDQIEGIAEVFGQRIVALKIDGQESLQYLLNSASIREQARERVRRLQALRETKRLLETKESEMKQAEFALGQAHERFRQQDSAHQAALKTAEDARQAAVDGVHHWRRNAAVINPDQEAMQATSGAILLYESHQIHPRSLLGPLQLAHSAQQEELSNRHAGFKVNLLACSAELAEIHQELDRWKAKREAVPPRSAEQEEARRLLLESGIKAVPLYSACDVRKGVTPQEAAQLEAVLENAGLLDALIVPREAAAQAEAILEAADLTDRWIRPSPASFGYTLSRKLEPIPSELSATDIAAALDSVALEEAVGDAGAIVSLTGSWRVGILQGRVSLKGKPQAVYLGEANRLLERQRQINRLDVACKEKSKEAAAIEGQIAAVEGEIRQLNADRRRLEELPELDEMQTAFLALHTVRQNVNAARAEMERSDKIHQQKLEQVRAVRIEVEEALRSIPEARGHNIHGINDLMRYTEATGNMAREIASNLAHLGSLRQRFGEIDREIEHAREGVQSAHDNLQDGEQRAQALGQQIETVRGLLRQADTSIDDILREIEQLKKIEAELEQTIGEWREAIGGAREQVKRGEKDVEESLASLSTADQDMREALDEFRTSLRAYSTLRAFMETAQTGVAEALAVVEDLLKFRRGEQGRMAELVKNARDRAWKALTAAYDTHKPTLNDQSPQLEGDYIWFRSDDGGRVLADDRRRELADHLRQQGLALSQHEGDLYEGFILQEVAKEIRDSITRAEEWRDNVNRLLAGRKLSQNAQISIDWRPLPPDRVTGVDHGRIVKLLRVDAETLTPDQIQEITGYFRARVAEVREKERSNALNTKFSDALREILDYRTWHQVILYKKLPDQNRLEWTDSRFQAGSGGEKALDMFIPLVAAVHARYAGALPDAPKLIGIDEAFSGVDEQNIREMFKYLVELDFGFVMTSEKLWGVSPTLPGCATYEMIKQEYVSMPVLYLWDGKVNLGAMDARWRNPQVGEEELG